MLRFAFFCCCLLIHGVGLAEEPAGSVVPSPSLLKQLKVMTIGQGEMRDSLRVPARVELDQQRVAHIGATVTGRIVETKAIAGQRVKKGEMLAKLHSTELGSAQSAYLKASSQVNLRRLAVDRAHRLFKEGVIASAQMQERMGALTEAEVDLRAATDQLRVLGMDEGDLKRFARERKIDSFIGVTSSLSGAVIERKVTLGQVVQPADALFTVADLSHVWLVAEVPEQQAQFAREGDEVVAEIAALPDHPFHGKLIYVADVVNPETRTVRVRMDLPNPDRVIKPQMLATLLIRKPTTAELLVPDAALVREGDHDYVFAEAAAGRFVLRQVSLGGRNEDMRRINDGLQAGERIVVEGAFHLNSERKRQELE